MKIPESIISRQLLLLLFILPFTSLFARQNAMIGTDSMPAKTIFPFSAESMPRIKQRYETLRRREANSIRLRYIIPGR